MYECVTHDMYVRLRNQSLEVSCSLPAGYLTEPRPRLKAASPSNLTVSAPPTTVKLSCKSHDHIQLAVAAGDLNSDPQACTADALT